LFKPVVGKQLEKRFHTRRNGGIKKYSEFIELY